MQAPQAAVWEVMSDLTRLGEWLDFAASVNDQSGPAAEEGATFVRIGSTLFAGIADDRSNIPLNHELR